MIVYKAENKINGRVYIGATVRSLNARKWEHVSRARNGSANPFHAAIRENGEDAFKWEVLDDSAKTTEELHELEKYYINKYDAMNSGYNSREGGGKGGKYSKEALQRIGEAMRGKHTGETNPNVKLTTEEAVLIKLLTLAVKTQNNMKADFEQTEIAEMFGISGRQVGRIITGKKWASLGTFEQLRDEWRRLFAETYGEDHLSELLK